jgi:AcrR family transcriptional regulator
MSKYSMKNKRILAKEYTRNLILEKTLEIIISNGIINTTTKQIADACNLAHGTLFAHFNNRETLIGSVIKNELLRIAQKLYLIAEKKCSFEQLLGEYLDVISEDENLLVVIQKEFSFLDDYLKNEIITTETIIKKFFYDVINSEINSENIKPVNISVLISCIFGSINHYLTRKEYYVALGSVIALKKPEIIKIFINFKN